MSLFVSVGIITDVAHDEEGVAAFQASLDGLSAGLADKGLTWREPDGSSAVEMRPHVGGFPYSCLHYLRRVYALVDNGEPVTPARGEEDLARDRHWIEESTEMVESHLLSHSDHAGYYVPVDFGDHPVFLSGVEGDGMVGSSQRLLSELCWCAPALGIRLDTAASSAGADTDDELSDAEAARLFALPPEADFATESMVWLTLYEACRVSIASGHAIVFH